MRGESLDKQLANEIIALLKDLVALSKGSDTKQGIATFQSFISKLSEQDCDLRDTLYRLNRNLAGIDAHGYFTDEESSVVNELFKLMDAKL